MMNTAPLGTSDPANGTTPRGPHHVLWNGAFNEVVLCGSERANLLGNLLRLNRSNAIRDAKNTRARVSPEAIQTALGDVQRRLHERLEQYGSGTYASRHEVLGILEDEMCELKQAINDSPLTSLAHHVVVKTKYAQSTNTVRAELTDVAVAALFALACIEADSLAW